MSKVETVDVVQSIPGRLLNYGTILIRGVGSSYEPLRLVSDLGVQNGDHRPIGLIQLIRIGNFRSCDKARRICPIDRV